MKIKKSKILIITMLMLLVAMCIAPMTAFATTEINKVEIGGSKFNYNAGDKPESYAIRSGDTAYYYDIEYEYWEEMETIASGASVPVKFWYSDENKNNALAQDKKITTFEEGKTYMYSISLKARDGYTFADNTEVYVNGEKVTAANVTKNESVLFITAIKTIKPSKPVQKQYIDEVEINNATVSFKVGDKPVFTGETPENAPYVYRAEFWETDGGNKGHNSSSMWNDNNPDKLFNTFEGGKTYTYGIYFVSYDYKGYFFTRDTKLKINGKYYNYYESEWESQPNVNEFSTMWITTNLTMTPKSEKLVDLIEITDVTTNFKVGDKPVFTGKVAKNSLYEIDNEGWSGANEMITSSEYWNNRYKDWGNAPLTSFKANTEYSYAIYVKLTDEATKNGYYFDKDKTKLSINGKVITMNPDSVSIDESNNVVAWFYGVLKMTPTENSQENPTTPSEPEKPSQEPVTPATPTQETENKTEQTKNEINNPKTGDNITTSIMLFVFSITTIGTLTIVNRKKVRE